MLLEVEVNLRLFLQYLFVHKWKNKNIIRTSSYEFKMLCNEGCCTIVVLEKIFNESIIIMRKKIGIKVQGMQLCFCF